MVRVAVALALAIAGCARGGGDGTADAAPGPLIDAPIDSNGCAVQPCSILPQCGCTGNTACDIDVADLQGTACRTINLEGDETSTCTNSMECDRGYVCLGDNQFASCKKYCTVDADCGVPRGRCIYEVTDNGVPITDIPKVCSSTCEPTDATAALCPSTYKCTLIALTDDKIVDCTPAGSGTQGTVCVDDTGCAKGFQCVKFSNESSFKCRRVCDVAGSCGGNSCIGFTDPFTVGGTTYGVCGP